MMNTASELNPFRVTECAASIRSIGKEADSFEEIASRVSAHLFDNLQTRNDSQRACALVRCFRTVDYQNLDDELRKSVLEQHPRVKPEDKFLTLFGTSGTEKNWNNRKHSAGHQAIPLYSAELINESPMIARLLSELGIEISNLLKAPSGKMEFQNPLDRDYNIFFVNQARNSPFIPAQESFVIPYGIQSVLGYGSLLPGNHFYAVIMFYRIKLPTAYLKKFTALALSTTIAVLSSSQNKLFKQNRETLAP